jgi:DNA-directed RNA polymerase subunit omega
VEILTMLEDLKEEEIVNKVGGRFKLSTLIQKRLVQLNAGSRALVDADTSDKMEIVLREIANDKIFLDSSNEVKITGELPEAGNPLDFTPDDL